MWHYTTPRAIPPAWTYGDVGKRTYSIILIGPWDTWKMNAPWGSYFCDDLQAHYGGPRKFTGFTL